MDEASEDGPETIALPRYARVNTLKSSFTHMQKELRVAGFEFVKPERRRGGQRRVKNEVSTKKSYTKDPHVPNLLVFCPRGSGLSKLRVVHEGALVIQQKASCLPVLALSPPLNACVIDACAAPGSKTSQLAALMQNTGTILAFDQDPRRLEILQFKMRERGATNVHATLQNFLETKPLSKLYQKVTHILLDPSCSSSGLHTHGPDLGPLVENQLKCIQHAMRFPNVQKIVYSTCSINDEENEQVVCEILDRHPEFELEHALPFWPRRGNIINGRADLVKCVRTLFEDKTIGFFLATFKKVGLSPSAASTATTTLTSPLSHTNLPASTSQSTINRSSELTLQKTSTIKKTKKKRKLKKLSLEKTSLPLEASVTKKPRKKPSRKTGQISDNTRSA